MCLRNLSGIALLLPKIHNSSGVFHSVAVADSEQNILGREPQRKANLETQNEL